MPGEDAGRLHVELLESDTRPEGFVVAILQQEPNSHLNPQFTEILPERDVVLQAIGGAGESGRNGGDGQPGRDGAAGANATTMEEAENGNNGGNGGA